MITPCNHGSFQLIIILFNGSLSVFVCIYTSTSYRCFNNNFFSSLLAAFFLPIFNLVVPRFPSFAWFHFIQRCLCAKSLTDDGEHKHIIFLVVLLEIEISLNFSSTYFFLCCHKLYHFIKEIILKNIYIHHCCSFIRLQGNKARQERSFQ